MSLKQGSPGTRTGAPARAPQTDTSQRRWNQLCRKALVLLLTVLLFTPVFSTVVRADTSPPLVMDQAHLDNISQTLQQNIQVTHNSPGESAAHTKAKPLSIHAADLPTYNNVGTSNDSAPAGANFDGSSNGYSAQALSAAGLVPGQSFQVDGTVFTWPDAAAGVLNNYVVSHQIIPVTPVANASVLAFLGASSGAPVSGTATITYTDTSTQPFTLGMSGWTLENGKDQPSYGNLTAATMAYHNAPGGKQSTTTYLFYASIDLQVGKTIQSVTLPATGSLGQMHVFAVSTRAPYNNVGSSDDGAPSAGNFDGGGASYSNQQLAKDGLLPGQTTTSNGTDFIWPNVSAGANNNYLARGQTLPVTPVTNANTIAFLGAAANGPVAGNATLTYTDGSTATFTLAMSDWTLNGGSAALAPGNSIAFTTTYRNTSSKSETVKTYLFYTETALIAGKTLQSITLPTISQGSLHVFSIGTRSQQVPTFNNVGTSADSSPGGGNFDGVGASYSAEALQAAGLTAGKQISRDGIFFTWPNVPAGSPNNYLAGGQVLPINPIANAAEIGFLGATVAGNSSGTAVITYADGSTQNITLSFTDWGTKTAASGNTIVASPAYFNKATGKATDHAANVYFSEFALQAGKILKSVTLPTSLNQGQMHIFAIGTRSYFNNIGISDNTNTSIADFDGAGDSYSAQEITNKSGMNWQPCDSLHYSGLVFTWPCVGANTPDNYQAQGQTIPVTGNANADTIAFAGASTNGPSSGTTIINYTDGSTQSFTLGMSDWTLNGFTKAPSYQNRVFAVLLFNNSPTGSHRQNTFIFYAQQKLQPNKTVQSVTLPSTSNQGQMHIFSITTGANGNVPNNVGGSDDASTVFSSYDTGAQSYSEQALEGAGINLGSNPTASFFFNGTQFNWTLSRSVIPDNYIANGQTIPITPVPNANLLAFVGAAAYGSSAGLANVTYTDGTTRSFTLGFTDWYSSVISYNNLLVANMSYHNTPTGRANIPTYLYYADTPLIPGKVVKSVTLPATTAPGEIHIFSIGTRGPSPYNNVGLADDASPLGANYDNNVVSASWSVEALKAVGMRAGANLTYNGAQFTWPNVPTGHFDNYQADGQTIPVTPVPNATTLSFIGSATNGPSTGTATITYTDDSTQTFNLSFQDWSSGTTLANNEVIAVTPYFNGLNGRVTSKRFLYYTETSLRTDKVIKSVTLPTTVDKGQLHVFAVSTRAGVYYNNAGVSSGDNPAAASFDTANNSYSAEALKSAGVVPGSSVAFDGIQFTWPNVPVGALNNYIAQGQTLAITPVDQATKLGFLGASAYGDAAGTFTITYTDGSTQNATVGMSDWLLQQNKNQPAFGNTIVASTSDMNTPAGKQNLKSYLFGAEVAVQPNKTLQSVTFPTPTGPGILHIFALGTRAASPYNNAGITDDSAPDTGNFDNNVMNASWSAQALQSVGITPGAQLTYNGIDFSWPNVSAGGLDNYQANGQVIPVTPVDSATTLAFIGAASNGTSAGTAIITYSDGSTQSFTLSFTDWTLGTTIANNEVAATVPYFNLPTGKTTGNHYVFYTETSLQANKTLQSVTLPASVNQGALHVFSIGTRAGTYYNNAGTTDDQVPGSASFDNGKNSYSAQALQSAGVVPGQMVAFDGIPFTWPDVPSGALNNYVAQGQTIPVAPVTGGVKLGFLGAAAYGDASGLITITYTDGTIQTATLGLSDWLLLQNKNVQPSFGNTIVAVAPYSNISTGKQNLKAYVFGAEFDLRAGKTVQSITLPSPAGASIMHIFAIGIRTDTLANNVGISDDARPQFANFNAGNNGSYVESNSYSAQALQVAGLIRGQPVTYNGVTFTWPNVPAGLYDNYQANGQTVPVTPVANATTLAFIGSASNGSATGTGTITYTDGTHQTFSLSLTDWATAPTAFGNGVVATMPYCNTPSGKLTTTVSLFYTDVTLQAGKTVKSVTMPPFGSVGPLHVFAIGTK